MRGRPPGGTAGTGQRRVLASDRRPGRPPFDARTFDLPAVATRGEPSGLVTASLLGGVSRDRAIERATPRGRLSSATAPFAAASSARWTSSTSGRSGKGGGVPVAVTISRGRRRGDIGVRRGGRGATRSTAWTAAGLRQPRTRRIADRTPRNHIPASPSASVVTDLVTSVTSARRRR